MVGLLFNNVSLIEHLDEHYVKFYVLLLITVNYGVLLFFLFTRPGQEVRDAMTYADTINLCILAFVITALVCLLSTVIFYVLICYGILTIHIEYDQVFLAPGFKLYLKVVMYLYLTTNVAIIMIIFFIIFFTSRGLHFTIWWTTYAGLTTIMILWFNVFFLSVMFPLVLYFSVVWQPVFLWFY